MFIIVQLLASSMFMGLLHAPPIEAETRTMIFDLRMPMSVGDRIVRESINQGINPEVPLAIAFRESRMRPEAFNEDSGSMGLFQLMPHTVQFLHVTRPFDATQSTIAGVGLIAHWKRTCGSYRKALKAFKSGHC